MTIFYISLLLVVKAKLNNAFSASRVCDALTFPISDTSASCPSSFSSSSFVYQSSARISATVISSFRSFCVTATSSSNIRMSSHVTWSETKVSSRD